MSNVNFSSQCPHCNNKIVVHADVTDDMLIPVVRGNIKPNGNILTYEITSEQIKSFLTTKIKYYVPDAKVEMIPLYCERKRNSKKPKLGVEAQSDDLRCSYASLRIACSDHVIDKNAAFGWYGMIGESQNNVRVVESMHKYVCDMYGYDRQMLKECLTYKNQEYLEDRYGITEPFIRDILEYVTPSRSVSSNNETWVVFSADATKVICDMLSDPDTNEPIGKIKIMNYLPMNNDIVKFVVYVYPSSIDYGENPHVRQILLGKKYKN